MHARGMAHDAHEVMSPSPLSAPPTRPRTRGPLQRIAGVQWMRRLRRALDERVHCCLGFVNVEVRPAEEGFNSHGFLPLPATMLRATIRELPEECDQVVFFPSRVERPGRCCAPDPASAGASESGEGAKASPSQTAAGEHAVESAPPHASAGTVRGAGAGGGQNDDGTPSSVPCHATLVFSAWSTLATEPVPESEVVAESVHAGPPSPTHGGAARGSAAKVQARRAYTNTAFVRGYFSTVLTGAVGYFLLLLFHVFALQLYRSGTVQDWHTNHRVHVLVLMIKLIAYPAALMYVWLSSLERVTALLVGEQLAREAASRVEQQRLFLRYVCHEVRGGERCRGGCGAGEARAPALPSPCLIRCAPSDRSESRSTRWSWAWTR